MRAPAFGYDFGSLIYRARINGGVGTYPLYEEGKLYHVTFAPNGGEHLRVDAGEFDTIATRVTSEFFDRAWSDGCGDQLFDRRSACSGQDEL